MSLPVARRTAASDDENDGALSEQDEFSDDDSSTQASGEDEAEVRGRIDWLICDRMCKGVILRLVRICWACRVRRQKRSAKESRR